MFKASVVDQFIKIHNEDPTKVTYEGKEYSKSYIKHKLLNKWVNVLNPRAQEALIYASWGQHIDRYKYPRKDYPEGKVGYLKWRNDIKEKHYAVVKSVLLENGISEDTLSECERILFKSGIKIHEDVQTMEDALCLVFLEWEIDDFLQESEITDEKIIDIIQKTAKKMSAQGLEYALTLKYSPRVQNVLKVALGL